MVSRLLKPLKYAGVIGDVVDVFTPSVKMSVVYNTNMEVHNGRGTVDPPQSRQHFKTREFAERNGLGSPVVVVYFNARRENAARFR
ncbi:hypothetical protein SUGI_1201490 [Cryptomeria japonica]|nr:hypothetical protein SUGI_1201490 [Cryptomeria japonica]